MGAEIWGNSRSPGWNASRGIPDAVNLPSLPRGAPHSPPLFTLRKHSTSSPGDVHFIRTAGSGGELRRRRPRRRSGASSRPKLGRLNRDRSTSSPPPGAGAPGAGSPRPGSRPPSGQQLPQQLWKNRATIRQHRPGGRGGRVEGPGGAAPSLPRVYLRLPALACRAAPRPASDTATVRSP